MKACTKCENEYPATAKYFHLNKQNKDGLFLHCKECEAIRSKKYKQTKHGREIRRKAEQKYRNTAIGHLRHRFSHIKYRCNNPNYIRYKDYGGRGIKCLFKSANEFIDYVINKLKINPHELQKSKLQIDRINNDGHYEKGNIRFITAKENANNRGNNV